MKKILFLIGPTASGKTDLSLKLAPRLLAEIISADSMQVYRGMNVGTDKPNKTARKRIPHHLIDICSPSKNFSVFEFRKMALNAVQKIEKYNRIPLIVGGSGFYIKALIDGLSPQPGADLGLRKKLQDLAREKGLSVLYSRLRQVDPVAARRIHKNDERRIVRALEIYEQTGCPMTEWEKESVSLKKLGYKFRIYGLSWERKTLYGRVQNRIEIMIRKGLVKEAKKLWRKNLSRTALQAVGYKELFDHFSGNTSLETATAEIVKNTRHLVKKQMTWFRRDKRIKWIKIDERQLDDVCSEIERDAKHWLKG